MPVTISDEVLAVAHISEPELKQELALTWFQQERLTLAQASRQDVRTLSRAERS